MMGEERRVKAEAEALKAEEGAGKLSAEEVTKTEAEKAEDFREALKVDKKPELRRRAVLQCPSCDSWLPQLTGPFCPFCHDRVGTPLLHKPSSSKVSEEDVEKELAELDEDVEAIKTARSGPDIRYYQCPRCRAYVDALVTVEGQETLVYDDLLVCPRCGFSEEFDSVEYEDGKPFFVTKYPLLKGEYVGHLDRRLRRAVRAANGEILQMGIFTADEQFDNEPQYPRALAAIMMGTAMHLGDKLERAICALEKLAFPSQKSAFSSQKPRGKRHRGSGKGKEKARSERAPKPDGGRSNSHQGGTK